MKTKIFSLVLLTTILIATVSAATNFTISPTKLVFSKSIDSANITVRNSGGSNLTLSISPPLPVSICKEDNSECVSLTLEGNVVNLAPDSSKILTAKIVQQPSNWENFELGKEYSKVITFTDSANSNETATLIFATINGLCKSGEVGKLSITELEDNELDNEDSWQWHPFDDVSFDVEVYNGFIDNERVKIEYKLRDSKGKKVDFDESNEQSISINDGDYEKVTFNLKVPADIDDGDYKLFIKSYLKSDESEGCVDKSTEFDNTYYQRISIDREEDRAVIVDKDNMEIPTAVNCGDIVSISPKIYNIGVEDEERVKVVLYNKELGVDLDEVINNFDTGESVTVDFSFKVPENVQGKTYIFNLVTNYEYDEDSDEYDSNSKNDLDEDFDFALKVNCIKEIQRSASITAELESSAIAGQQLVIKGTIKNTGANETVYSLTATEYNSWAVLDKIDPLTVTLKAGESKDFLVYLNVNEDVQGEQFLTLMSSFDGKTTEQEVSVTLEEAQGVGGITGAAIAENIKKNWFIWVIVVINIILIIAIIAVARRIVTSR